MNTATLHEMADDCADWAVHHCTSIDLERRIAEKMQPLPRELPAEPEVTEVATEVIEQPAEAASAVSGIGFENEPAPPPLPRYAYLLAPAFDRWPRATTAVVMTVLLAIWGFAGQLDLDAAAELAR